MDQAVSISRRLEANEAGIRSRNTHGLFHSPVFPGITDFEKIFERVKDQCDWYG